MITLDSPRSLQAETATFWALMWDVAAADKAGDSTGRYEALDELSVFAMYADAPPLRARAAAEVERHGFQHNKGPEGAAADALAAIMACAGGFPDNCIVTTTPDGDIMIREI